MARGCCETDSRRARYRPKIPSLVLSQRRLPSGESAPSAKWPFAIRVLSTCRYLRHHGRGNDLERRNPPNRAWALTIARAAAMREMGGDASTEDHCVLAPLIQFRLPAAQLVR